MEPKIIFHQLFENESSTYTYLLGDPVSKEAILIDPVIETVDRDLKLLKELGLNLKFILDTHVHADHVTASGDLRKRTGAKIGLSSAYKVESADLQLQDGQILTFGPYQIEVIHTPGHTNGCLSFRQDKFLFTGDALLIRGCGRTDFQEGSSEKLFTSVREKLFSLPDDTEIFPGHDYKGFSKSTIGIEKKFNPRLNLEVSKEQFIQIMSDLKLAYPKKIDIAVEANLHSGLNYKKSVLEPFLVDGVPTVNADQISSHLGQLRLIDVRRPDEFNNELGHIPQAVLATLGPELEQQMKEEDPSQEIVFICRSGKRSADATKTAQSFGFQKVYNLQGGMLQWNELKFPVERT